MLYPLLSEYIEAILSPEDSFDELKDLRPVLDEAGRPIMSSGNFAVVFKMEDNTGKQYAVKCFLKEQTGRAKDYKYIEERLNDVSSPFFVNFQYYDKELFVDSANSEQKEFPVLKMDWVEGLTLNEYIQKNIQSTTKIKYLPFAFSKMASWLLKQDFAHGDIKPDNILIKRDGSIILVDYDGMYVPKMGYGKGSEVGTPGFRHPSRTKNDFHSHNDDFSLVVILLSLKIISSNPSLFSKRMEADKLLFSEDDFGNILRNEIVLQIYPSEDEEINRLMSLFLFVLSHETLEGIDCKLIEIENPIKSIIGNYRKGRKIRFSNGLIYSEDKKCLLSGVNITSTSLTIPQGTEFIADKAFSGNTTLTELYLPTGLLSVGSWAFEGCENLERIAIPDTILNMEGRIFYGCKSLYEIESPYLRNRCLIIHGELKAVISIDDIDELTLPKDAFQIDAGAFAFCPHIGVLRLQKVLPSTIFPYEGASIKRIVHDSASIDGHSIVINNELQDFVADAPIDYQVPDNVINIKKFSFMNNKFLTSISFPSTVVSIGTQSFSDCENLQEITLPNHLKEIGFLSFSNCRTLKDIHIPNSVIFIDAGAFYDCKSLKKVTLSKNIKEISNHTFRGCESLGIIKIPDSVRIINKEAFAFCNSLYAVTFGAGLGEIQYSAFKDCHQLHHVKFKSAPNYIHPDAFNGCESLRAIIIPIGTLQHFRKLHAQGAFKNNNIYFGEFD